MKLTWFGSTAFRVHIGGQVVVIDAGAASGVDDGELVSGADLVTGIEGHAAVDGHDWRPRPRERLLDAEGQRPVALWSPGPGALLLDADEEPPLLILAGDVPALGRWADRAVVVLAGDDLAARDVIVVNAATPRLIGLAAEEKAVDAAFAALRDALDGTGLVAFEHGLAVEA